MPPRIPRQMADAIGRSAGPQRLGASSISKSSSNIILNTSNASSRLLSSSTTTSTSPLTSTAASTSSTITPQSRATVPFRSFTTTSTHLSSQQNTTTSRSTELHATTAPADHGGAGHSPVPQRRLPRWAATPSALRAPFSVRKNEPANRFAVNEDPARLDQAYESVFGSGGAQLLPAEVKWLAVTHKSFDQGRRGFNDRLAFVGKRLVDLQTSLAVLAQENSAGEGVSEGAAEDAFGREVFRHPVMEILPKLTGKKRAELGQVRKVALLAREFGLQAVVRWKPRQAADLMGSGQDGALVQALYAMVGALAMHRGGDVAVKAVRARILPRLGLRV